MYSVFLLLILILLLRIRAMPGLKNAERRRIRGGLAQVRRKRMRNKSG
jgi:hypothetical protein